MSLLYFFLWISGWFSLICTITFLQISANFLQMFINFLQKLSSYSPLLQKTCCRLYGPRWNHTEFWCGNLLLQQCVLILLLCFSNIFSYWKQQNLFENLVELLAIFFLALSMTHFVFRSSRPEVFLRKGVLKICSKFTGGHPCRSAISIKFLHFNKCFLGLICILNWMRYQFILKKQSLVVENM